jgi:hypothetical protein
MSTTEAKTIGHPDRFAYNGDGTVDWQTSTSQCLGRAEAMVDMIYAYVSSNRGGFPDLYTNTLESQLHAIQAELQDVGKLIEGWHHEQWQKEQKKS